jgi:predicted RNA-binding Zn-ribbon protein involved in translation (DUF1610 family)
MEPKFKPKSHQAYYAERLCPACGERSLNMKQWPERPYPVSRRLECLHCGWRGPWAQGEKECFAAAKPEMDAAEIVRAL